MYKKFIFLAFIIGFTLTVTTTVANDLDVVNSPNTSTNHSLEISSANITSPNVKITPLKKGSILIHVNGMVCEFCAVGLDKMFAKNDAVSYITVSLKNGTVLIHLKENQNITDQVITSTIENNGLTVRDIVRPVKTK